MLRYHVASSGAVESTLEHVNEGEYLFKGYIACNVLTLSEAQDIAFQKVAKQRTLNSLEAQFSSLEGPGDSMETG